MARCCAFSLLVPVLAILLVSIPARGQDGAGESSSPERWTTNRESGVDLPLPEEEDAFFFVIFGDRTGGPVEGVEILRDAVEEVNVLAPDLVMTVGDLIEGYNHTGPWMRQMREYRGIMEELKMPWFPVAGNHDIYWRGPDRPAREHEESYETHFGPLWYAFRHKGCWFVVLFSDEGDPGSGRKSFNSPEAQRMSPEQFAWLEATLEDARGADHVFVFLHHPRWLKGGYGDDWDRVHRLLTRAGNVTAVFAGHIHRMRYDGKVDGIEYFTLATTGGHQSGVAPRAGYLHHYHIVTVREPGLAVATIPVGTVIDPRQVTGEVSDAARRLSRLPVRFREVPAVNADLNVGETLLVEIENPVSRPIEVTVQSPATEDGWRLGPDHRHGVIPGGETRPFEFVVRRVRPFDPALVPVLNRGRYDLAREWALGATLLPRIEVQADYLAEGARFSLPARTVTVPLRGGPVPPDPRPDLDGVAALDGRDDYLRVPEQDLDLPDGPFTVECWFRAADVRGRRGLVTKAEQSEFGLFLIDGSPSFLVHLDGAYVEAKEPKLAVAVGSWNHVAGVYDGEEVRLYLNGRRVARAPARGRRTPNDLPLLIGADVTGAGGAMSFFAGQIDEVRVSAVARYEGKRSTPRRRGRPAQPTDRLLLHLDGERGPWVYDHSRSGAHPVRMGGARVETGAALR